MTPEQLETLRVMHERVKALELQGEREKARMVMRRMWGLQRRWRNRL